MNWKKNLRENKTGLSVFRPRLLAWLLAMVFLSVGCRVNDDFPGWSGSMEAGYDSAFDITVDASGNAFIVGHTTGSLDQSSNQGGMDLFLAKYDSSNDRKWATHLGSDHNDRGLGAVIDQSGNIFVAGHTYGDVAGNLNHGNSDILWVKYKSDGSRQWVKQFGTEEIDQATAIAIDASSGDILTTGHTRGNLAGESYAGYGDAFIIRCDSNGNRKWTRLVGSSEAELSLDIAVDGSGDVIIVGYTYGALAEQSHAGLYDIFIAKYDSTGDQKWIKQFGSAAKDFGLSLAANSSNDILVAGYTYGDLDGSGDNSHKGGSDIFVAKYDSTGDQKWIKQLGTSSDEEAKAISIDMSGDIIIVGQTSGTLEGSNQGGRDIFLIKIKDLADVTDDAIKWTRQIGTAADDFGVAIAVDASNDILATGQTYGDLNGVVNKGHSDIFLLRRDSSGDPM